MVTDHVELQVQIGEALQVCEEAGLGNSGCDHPTVDPYAAEKPILREESQMVSERRIARLEVSDEADNERVALSETERPLIVLKPGARLDEHGPGNAQAFRSGQEISR